MSLDKCWNSFDSNTESASKIARQLAFAGIAVVWIFTIRDGGSVTMSDKLLWPSLIFVVALAADFMQYIAGSLVWFFYARHKEKKFGANFEGELTWNPKVNYIGFTFFWMKCVLVMLGYATLIRHIYQQIQLVS